MLPVKVVASARLGYVRMSMRFLLEYKFALRSRARVLQRHYSSGPGERDETRRGAGGFYSPPNSGLSGGSATTL